MSGKSPSEWPRIRVVKDFSRLPSRRDSRRERYARELSNENHYQMLVLDGSGKAIAGFDGNYSREQIPVALAEKHIPHDSRIFVKAYAQESLTTKVSERTYRGLTE